MAGGADAISGIFRMTMWNQTIPDALRGRLASIEMVSYTSGPLLGHVEAGRGGCVRRARVGDLRRRPVRGRSAGLRSRLPRFVRYDAREFGQTEPTRL